MPESALIRLMLDKMHVVLVGDKEIKVRIPARLHVMLHAMKIQEGQAIQTTVAQALEEYFRRIAREQADRAEDPLAA